MLAEEDKTPYQGDMVNSIWLTATKKHQMTKATQ